MNIRGYTLPYIFFAFDTAYCFR